jgi:protein involved in polysaccharide export with SLBB domain
MSERILKLLTQEDTLNTTPGTRNGGQLFRIRNSHASNPTSILIKDDGDTVGSISLYPGEVIYIRKKAAETIEASAGDTSIRIVQVAFGD